MTELEIESTVDNLTESEKIVMRVIPRISKSKNNIFSQSQLERRKACWDMNVTEQLQSLANKGLLNRVRKGVWQTTPIGRRVAHFLENEEFSRRYPFPVIRR